jgi:hypothetical protein
MTSAMLSCRSRAASRGSSTVNTQRPFVDVAAVCRAVGDGLVTHRSIGSGAASAIRAEIVGCCAETNR